MAAQTSPHWTEDEEVLDRYILGRIDPAAKRVLEEHLESCAQCREAVSRTRDLVAGIRRLGRDELKARLKRKLEPASRPAVPWPHVISAAAVLVIALGVGIYAFWSPLETWYEGTLSSASADTASPAASVVEETREKFDDATRGDIAARNEALLKKIDRLKGEDQKIVAAPAPKAASEPSRERELGATASLASAWIQGVIVPREGKDAAKLQVLPTEVDARERKKLEAADRDVPQIRRQEGAAVSQAVPMELRQQPIGALPESKQQLQLTQAHQTVETLLEQTSQGLRLTMYLEEAIPDSELQSAEVYAVTDDSLVVLLPTRQIAYKIPSSIGNVQAIQLKAK